MPPSLSTVPAPLTVQVRAALQIGALNTTVGGLLPAGSDWVVTFMVTGVLACPHLSST